MYRYRKWIFATIPLISLIAIQSSYGQQFYKWTDAKGVMQYTQTPPPPQHKIAANTQPFEDRASQIKKRNDQARMALKMSSADEQAAESAKKNAEAEANSRNKNAVLCQQLRQNLLQLKSGQRFRTIDGDGSRGYLSEEQKAAQIQQLSAQIQSYCPQFLIFKKSKK